MNPVLNYDQLLALWSIEQVGQPFTWGKTDCASLVRRAVKIMFGRDVFRGKVRTYRSRPEAMRVMQKAGGFEKALEIAGFRRVRRGYWHDGDVVVLPKSARRDEPGAVGVVIDHKLLTAASVHGVCWRLVEQLPRRVKCYRLVGHGR